MKKAIPRWFTALLVAVLLLCSAVVASSLFYEASLRGQISDVQQTLSAVQGRLRKQEQEYAEYVAALPAVLAELSEVEPQAAAAYDQEQLLRQQHAHECYVGEVVSLGHHLCADHDVCVPLAKFAQQLIHGEFCLRGIRVQAHDARVG